MSFFFFFLMIRRPPRSTQSRSSAASDVYKRQAQTWAELFYLAAFNSLLGAVLWNYGTRHLPGAAVGAFLYLLPVVAVPAGYLILRDPITPWLVAGGAIMLAGVALAQSGTRQH